MLNLRNSLGSASSIESSTPPQSPSRQHFEKPKWKTLDALPDCINEVAESGDGDEPENLVKYMSDRSNGRDSVSVNGRLLVPCIEDTGDPETEDSQLDKIEKHLMKLQDVPAQLNNIVRSLKRMESKPSRDSDSDSDSLTEIASPRSIASPKNRTSVRTLAKQGVLHPALLKSRYLTTTDVRPSSLSNVNLSEERGLARLDSYSQPPSPSMFRQATPHGSSTRARRISHVSGLHAVILPQQEEAQFVVGDEIQRNQSSDSCGALSPGNKSLHVDWQTSRRGSTISNLTLALGHRRPSNASMISAVESSMVGSEAAAPARVSLVSAPWSSVVPSEAAAPARELSRELDDCGPKTSKTLDLSPLSPTERGGLKRLVSTGSCASARSANSAYDSDTGEKIAMTLPPSRGSLQSIATSVDPYGAVGDVGEQWRQCILLPTSTLRRVWDAFVMIGIIFTAIALPIETVYVRQPDNGVRTVLHTVDILWIVDIGFNFRTAFISAGRIIRCPRAIAMRYARSWLVLDVMAAWPLVLSPLDTQWSFLFWWLKLLKIARLSSIITRIQQEILPISLLPLRVVLSVFLYSHIMACIWQASQRSQKADAPFLQRIANTDDGLVAMDPDHMWFDVYASDVYFVIMTVTTVGYGDTVPVHTLSRLFASLVMLTAPIFSGLIISALTHSMRSFFDDKVEHRVADVTAFMIRRGLSLDLQRRIQHNLRQNMHQQNRIDPEILETLSPAVRRELSLAVLGGVIRSFSFFREAHLSFVAEFAQSGTLVQCSLGDIIAEEGQLQQELVFIVDGCCMSQRWVEADSSRLIEKELQAGAWFGEPCLFQKEAVHSETITAAQESELAVFLGSEYHRIMRRFPTVLQRHCYLEKAIADGKVSVKQLAYHKSAESKKKMRGSLSMMALLPSLSMGSAQVSDLE